jgi:hypothetical protein
MSRLCDWADMDSETGSPGISGPEDFGTVAVISFATAEVTPGSYPTVVRRWGPIRVFVKCKNPNILFRATSEDHVHTYHYFCRTFSLHLLTDGWTKTFPNNAPLGRLAALNSDRFTLHRLSDVLLGLIYSVPSSWLPNNNLQQFYTV